MDAKEKKRLYKKEYNARPEVKERSRLWAKDYNARPEVKERLREYNANPNEKEKKMLYDKEYKARPEVIARLKDYFKEHYAKHENKERIKENVKRRYKERSEDPASKIQLNESCRLRQVKYRSNPGVRDRCIERLKEWRAKPDTKLLVKEYLMKPEVKERLKHWNRAWGGSHFTRAVKRGNPAVRFRRIDIFIRDNYTCLYCNKEFDIKELHLDHIMPLAAGGAHIPENCATSCRKCNLAKGAKILDNLPVVSGLN